MAKENGVKALLIQVEKAKESKESESKDKILNIQIDRMEEVLGTSTIKVKVEKSSKFYDMLNERNILKRNSILVSRSIVEPHIMTEENRKAFDVTSNYELVQALFTESEVTTLAGYILNNINSVNLVDDIKN